MDENLGEFSLEFQKPLEPLQLVRHGRKKGPLGRSLRTVKVDQHGKAMDDKSTNVPPRSDFCVDYKTGNIIPSLSTGMRDKVHSICVLPTFVAFIDLLIAASFC